MIKILDYTISADNFCYTVSREAGVDKNGEVVYKALAYPTTLRGCCEYIIGLEQRKSIMSGDLNLEEAIIKFKEINAEIKDLMGKIDG